jgi:hypothetical protein
MSHPDHQRSFKSHMSHWSLNELFAKYIEIHILEFWPAVSCFEIRKHLCHRFGSNANTPLGQCVQTASHATDLAGLWCSSHWNHWSWAHQAQGKTKNLCVCMCVYVILCLRSYLYLLKPFSMQQMWIISKAAGDYLLHGLYSPRAFAHRACLRTRHCPSQWSSQSAVLSWTKILHTLICLGLHEDVSDQRARTAQFVDCSCRITRASYLHQGMPTTPRILRLQCIAMYCNSCFLSQYWYIKITVGWTSTWRNLASNGYRML